MQHFQSHDQQDNSDNCAYKSADLLGDVVIEPQGVGELIGLAGEGVQYGGEVMIDASSSVLELLGELLGGLLS